MEQTAVEWLLSELQVRLLKIKSEPVYFIRETMINNFLIDIEQAKKMEREQNEITENTSDGYHTFKILYEIRKAYNVALFNEWAMQKFSHLDIPKYNVHKSRKHHDGEYPFGNNNWFIVCAELPNGKISNHYTMDNWDLFKIPEYEKALYPFDGHTTNDVVDRLLNL